jgi:hypothetical protein
LCAILSPVAPAQVQRNAGFEPTVFAVTKAKLVLSPEEEIEQGTLVIRDGLIVAAGKDAAVPADAEVIDATGLVVYPGFIDAGTSVLLDPNRGTTPVAGRPIDFARFALAATPPDNRKSLTPEFEAPQGLKTDLGGIEQRRKAGFTAVHIVPSGRVAGGKGALLSTSGLPLREALLDAETFPEFQLFNPPGGGYPATLMGAIAHLRQAFLNAAGISSITGCTKPRPPASPGLPKTKRCTPSARSPTPNRRRSSLPAALMTSCGPSTSPMNSSSPPSSGAAAKDTCASSGSRAARAASSRR